MLAPPSASMTYSVAVIAPPSQMALYHDAIWRIILLILARRVRGRLHQLGGCFVGGDVDADRRSVARRTVLAFIHDARREPAVRRCRTWRRHSDSAFRSC